MSDTPEQTRKPGRPKSQSTEKPVKKGKSSWQPASVTDVVDKEPGYRYRWINKNPDNMAKKEAEGWDLVNGLTSDRAIASDDGRIDSGKQLTSTYEKCDVILARMPEETALERDAYIADKTKRRTLGLTAHLKKEVGKSAPVHGEITISSLREQQVID